jgi:hypothetical protein
MREEISFYFFLRLLLVFRHILYKASHTLRRSRSGENAIRGDAGSSDRLCNPARDSNLRSFGHPVVHHLCGNLHS